jgi:lipoprotein NlpD
LRFSRSIGTVGLCCLLVGGCASVADGGPQIYVVRAEDTLYSIAWRHDLDFHDLARWNNIGADFRITVGQVLVLRPGVAPRSQAPRPSPPNTARAPSPPRAASAPLTWVWPTDHVGAPQPVPGGGILLSGRLGQDIRAASAGHVVYTGSGIRGYGNLIIIKHGDILLSAYAHNRDVLVQEGQDVAAGQVIAHMGEGAHQAPVLYFEIRQNGKPVDPLPYLK